MEQNKTARFEVSTWYNEETGHIHLALPNTITTVNNDEGSVRCHKNLFRKLADVLRAAGKPAPETEHRPS